MIALFYKQALVLGATKYLWYNLGIINFIVNLWRAEFPIGPDICEFYLLHAGLNCSMA